MKFNFYKKSKTILGTTKYYDIEGKGFASYQNFIDILKYYGCCFNKNEI